MTKEEIQKKYFESEETVLWSDAPDALSYFVRADIFLLPLSLLVGGFLLFNAYLSFVLMLRGQSMAFSLSGITCLLIGIYLIFGRIWYRHKRISKNLYFVTDRRVFIFNTLRDSVLLDMPITEAQPECFLNTLFLGRKTLGGDVVYGLGLDIFFHNFVAETPAFYAISKPEAVKKQIHQAKKMRKKEKYDTDNFI